MATETIRNGQIIRLNLLPGESIAVAAVSGTYNASIVQGAGVGVIATNATGATYGPYPSGIVINLTASAASEVDFDIGLAPLVVADTIIPPGTPIGNVTPGSGEFTTLSSSGATSFATGGTTDTVIGGVTAFDRLHVHADSAGAATIKISNVNAGAGGDTELFLATSSTHSSEAIGVRLLADRTNATFAGDTDIVLSNTLNGVMTERVRILSSGRASWGGAFTPTARLHLAAGIAAASGAPLKLSTGVNLTVVENGAFEFDGSALFFTHGGVRRTITMV